MDVTVLEDIRRVVLGMLPTASGAGRSLHKTHLTDVIKYIQRKAGIGYSGRGFDDIKLTQDVGFIWEEVAERMASDEFFSRAVWAEQFEDAWKKMLRAARLGEIEIDGIVCSPDGVGEDPLEEHLIAVHEYKCTWKSIKTPPQDNWYYMTQLKSYCRAVGTLCAVMHVMYLMGNYKGSGPIWLPVRIGFTQAEIDENWEMILNNKEHMEKTSKENKVND